MVHNVGNVVLECVGITVAIFHRIVDVSLCAFH